MTYETIMTQYCASPPAYLKLKAIFAAELIEHQADRFAGCQAERHFARDSGEVQQNPVDLLQSRNGGRLLGHVAVEINAVVKVEDDSQNQWRPVGR